MGYDVQDFPSAEAFLASVSLREDDFVIADIHMSGMTGIELLENLRASGNPLAVILITGRPTAELKARAQAAGGIAVLEKPFDGAKILGLVADALKP